MDVKSESLQLYEDLVVRRARVEKEMLERKILNEFYNPLKSVIPEFVYCTPTPMPLVIDEDIME